MDIIISLPDNQIPVSNGLLIDEVDLGGGRKKYHWKEKYPISTYLVSITTYPYRFWSDSYISHQNDTMPIDFYVYPNHYDITYDNYKYVPKGKSFVKVINKDKPTITCRYVQPLEEEDGSIDDKNRGIVPRILIKLLTSLFHILG